MRSCRRFIPVRRGQGVDFGQRIDRRKGAILVLTAMLLVVIFGFVAFTVDVGHMCRVKAQLQSAADGAALGGVQELAAGVDEVRLHAKSIAQLNVAAGAPVSLENDDIELGVFDLSDGSFVLNETAPNALRVTARLTNTPYFFAPVMGTNTFSSTASCIAMLNPRDIVFVVDRSGSMNDDTEPCWATEMLPEKLASQHQTVPTEMIQEVYDDFGFGVFPGTTQFLGEPLLSGLPSNKTSFCYAELTDDYGPLTEATIPVKYRIDWMDDEVTRKVKAYSWIIDNQIATLMPNASPLADSDVNYAYWEKYIDYLIYRKKVGEDPPSNGNGNNNGSNNNGSSNNGSNNGNNNGGGNNGGNNGGGPPPPPDGGIGMILPTQQPSFFPALSPGNGMLRTDVHDNVLHSEPTAHSSNRYMTVGYFAPSPPRPPEPTGAPMGTPRRGETLEIRVPEYVDGDGLDDLTRPVSSGGAVQIWNPEDRPQTEAKKWRWKIGYRTYVQFMMDWGSNGSPLNGSSWSNNPGSLGKTPIALGSGMCPLHSEIVGSAGTFSFPPRAQPMHSVRRSLISTINMIAQRNQGLASGLGDRVAIVAYDGRGNDFSTEIVLPLTDDYDAAMQACTTLQAVADIGQTTYTEGGLQMARTHLGLKTAVNNPFDEAAGIQGRGYSKKVIVLITDGMPNVWDSTETQVQPWKDLATDDYYYNGWEIYNSSLMQAHRFRVDDKGALFAIGMGVVAPYVGIEPTLDPDFTFLDRMAQVAETSDANGFAPQSSGNPAEYETVLSDALEDIVKTPGSRMVK